MATLFNTVRGNTYEPLPAEVWRWDGRGPEFPIETAEKISVTWADRESGVGEYDVRLTDLTAPLLACDGQYLLVSYLNGKRHLSVPITSVVYNDGETDVVNTRITTATGWNLLQGQRIPPVPDMPLHLQGTAENYVLTGPVETVVKTLLQFGAERTGHPIYTLPDLGRGPEVTITSRFETVAELVEGALAGTGYRLNLETWLPGDNPTAGFDLSRPAILAEVMPYQNVPGLVFIDESGDLDKWEVERTRFAETRVILGDSGEGIEQRFTTLRYDPGPSSPWAMREGFETVDTDEGEDRVEVGIAYLEGKAASVSASATVAPAGSWEFGTDGVYAAQYDIGDIAELDLGIAGVIEQVVTEVTAELTPTEFTVTPVVSTPDTMRRDLYTTIVDLEKRVARQERGK